MLANGSFSNVSQRAVAPSVRFELIVSPTPALKKKESVKFSNILSRIRCLVNSLEENLYIYPPPMEILF